MSVIGGAGGGSIEFAPRAAEEVPGIRMTLKICELCTKTFAREGQEKECKSCAATLEKQREPKPRITPEQEEAARWLERQRTGSELEGMRGRRVTSTRPKAVAERAARARRKAEREAARRVLSGDSERPASVLGVPLAKAVPVTPISRFFSHAAAAVSSRIQ